MPLNHRLRTCVALVAVVAATLAVAPGSGASTPDSSTLAPPTSGEVSTVTWTGGPYTGVTADPSLCTEATCDSHALTLDVPADFWGTHAGSVAVEIEWSQATDDFDLYVKDDSGAVIADSASANTTREQVDLGQLAPGTYSVEVVPFTAVAGSYSGTATLTAVELAAGMVYPETRQAVEDELTVDYPINVIFVGRQPSAAEVAELKQWIPDMYRPTVVTKTDAAGDIQHTGAALLNWNKQPLNGDPYFEGIRFNYQLNVVTASDAYAKAMFQVAEDNTAQAQTYHGGTAGTPVGTRTANQVRYDATFGNFRVLAKGGDLAYKVLDPTKTDLVDAYAVEDWIFNSRYDPQWACAFTNVETGACVDPSIIDPDATAYHDPYYDRDGLNLDRMPQGLNKGSSFFFLDTFSPGYAKDYFRPAAYHTYGTDKVINGAIVPKSVDEGGSWRITDPDTGDWDGVDYARTWGGRYRFHFIDLGAAPNDYESATWAGKGLGMSSDYPHGDPPIWQYQADPLWQQPGGTCALQMPDLPYNNNTPCRLMPRLGRDVAYGLFFRSTAGYLYRPIPRGDTYWLAVSNWTDFYSRPQWVNGQLTNAPWYGTWWTNTDKLYRINQVGENEDDTLRWLSSALPYATWVGRKGEVIPLYDPTNNQPTGGVLDTSPKYEDLPAPEHHVHLAATGTPLVPEPLYPGHHEHAQYGDITVDLTAVSNAVEKAKAHGVLGLGYDDSVNHESFRDFIDANPAGIADRVEGVNTIPSINMVFEKAYTWALPAIVGGIAVGTTDGEAWGVMNNVNDRVKWSQSHYPAVQPGDPPGSKRSLIGASLPTQDSGGGFSYTIEHEAAHNLGLSHPHDGALGVDRCPDSSPNAGEWKCYWGGLGWMYDISAAPTTYAMSYRPYEVEDQDNLQRGHVAEYLLGSQEALSARLVDEARAGRTTPSAAWTADFDRMKNWRAQAGELFRNGDYLHAEYAARNAALAARGVPQTAENTIDPSLVGAGQVFYFNVHPQADGVPVARPDLAPTSLTSAQPKPKKTDLTVTVTNSGAAAATGVTVQLLDGITPIGITAPVDIAAGTSRDVTLTWSTRNLSGARSVTAVVDPASTVVESDETNNRLTATVTIRGNRVANGSFEDSANGTGPDGWNGGTGTTYDTSGAHSADGTDAVSATGGSLLASRTWKSAPIAVSPGATYGLSTMVGTQGQLSTAPQLQVQLLNSAGGVVNTVTGLAGGVTGPGPFRELTGQLTIPADVSSVRLVLTPNNPLDLLPSGTAWFDDVWLW